MPEPQTNETHDEFITRCVPIVIDDGTAQDPEQAVAVCNAFWDKAKKTYAVKTISQNADTATVAGYGVLFGGEDLEGEHFAPDTDFMLDLVPVKLVFYDHALDEVKHTIGKATARQDESGLWVEAQLDKHRKYVEQILELIDQGVIGWSSGTVGHLVQRDGKAIKRWPVIEFSLTPTPAEPRTLGVERLAAMAQDNPELKALLPQGAGDAPVDAAAGERAKIHNLENFGGTKTMSDVTLSMEEYKALLQSQVKAPDAPPAPPSIAEDPAVKALSDKLNALTQFIEKSPALKDAGYVAPDSEEDHAGTKSLGDFLVAVRNGNDKRLKSVYKTALAEDSGSTGGYLVPTQLAAPILAGAKQFSILRQAGATIIPASGAEIEIPLLDVETAPSAGNTSYAAGVIAYWGAEAGTVTESEPRFRMAKIPVNVLTGYSLASKEVTADSAAQLEAILTTTFSNAVGSTENYAFLRGDGVNKPLGIVSSGALISDTRSGASAVALADLGDMMTKFLPESYTKGVWICSPSVVTKLIQLVSSPLSWMTNLRDGMPTSIFGMPLYVTGALPSLNTAGDILLIDPSYYVIADRQDLTISFSPHYKFVNRQNTWLFEKRVGGQPWVSTYITLEDGSTTVSPFVALAAG